MPYYYFNGGNEEQLSGIEELALGLGLKESDSCIAPIRQWDSESDDSLVRILNYNPSHGEDVFNEKTPVGLQTHSDKNHQNSEEIFDIIREILMITGATKVYRWSVNTETYTRADFNLYTQGDIVKYDPGRVGEAFKGTDNENYAGILKETFAGWGLEAGEEYEVMGTRMEMIVNTAVQRIKLKDISCEIDSAYFVKAGE